MNSPAPRRYLFKVMHGPGHTAITVYSEPTAGRIYLCDTPKIGERATGSKPRVA